VVDCGLTLKAEVILNMVSEERYKEVDLRPYFVFGKLPLLKLLFGLTALSLIAVAIYEFIL
jgi:hypothetical protein